MGERNNPALFVAEVVNDYAAHLRRYILGQVRNRDDAEDLLQDVFCKLAETTGGEEEGSAIENVSAWLYRVARNTVLNFWRKRREVPIAAHYEGDDAIDTLGALMFTGDVDNPDGMMLRGMVWDQLDSALAELPAEQCEVFCMTVFEGYSMREISEITGVAVATLLSRKHYAVKHLRRRLQGLYKDICSM